MAAQYRADHVGSLLRPPELLAARDLYREGRITREELTRVEDESILKALDMQRGAGIGIYSDGEYRRLWFAGGFVDNVEGLIPDPDARRFVPEWKGPHREEAIANQMEFDPGVMVAAAKLRMVGRITGREAGFLKQHSPGPWKMTLTPPGFIGGATFKPGISDSFYATPRDLLDDVIRMYQEDLRGLVADGAAYIQLDSLAYASSVEAREQLLARGIDPEKELDDRIAIDNAVLGGVDRSKATLAIHICRGNSAGAWVSAGDYEFSADKAFNRLNVDRFLLEYDTERSGGFEPLRFMPKNKTAVLGLISTKTPELESPDRLLRRIDEASKYIPVENMAIGPQCGFAAGFRGNPLSWDDQRRKLELVVQVARKVWGRSAGAA